VYLVTAWRCKFGYLGVKHPRNKTRGNSTLVLLERAYRLREFTRKWLQNPKYTDHRPLFTTQDEWTIVKYIMEALRPFRYWTLWMSKRHTVRLHHVITLYNDRFDHMDGVMRALAKKKTQRKEDLFFAMKLARRKLSKYYAEVTPWTGMLPISAHILDPFHKFRLFRNWDKGMDIDPEDETSYTTQYQEAFRKYAENEYCAKHQHVPVNQLESLPSSNLTPSATASWSCELSFDPSDFSSNEDEYLTPNHVAQMTPGRSDRAARLLTTTRLYLNSPPEAPMNWGQINPILNDYHSDQMEISSTFWLPDITVWLRQQEETHSKYIDLSNVARDIFSITPHGVRVEASFSLGQDFIGWRQSKTTGETLCKKVSVRQFAQAKMGFWQALTHYWIQQTQNATRKWRKRRRKGNCTEWPWFMTFWRCGRAAKTYMLPRRNLVLKTRRWPQWDTFRTAKRLSKHPGHSYTTMVRLNLNCQKDLHSHHLCLQMTSLEDEFSYWMFAECGESTVIQWNVMRIAHLKAFRTQKIGLTGMGT